MNWSRIKPLGDITNVLSHSDHQQIYCLFNSLLRLMTRDISSHLKSVAAQLFVQQLVEVDDKGYTKAQYCLLLVMGIVDMNWPLTRISPNQTKHTKTMCTLYKVYLIYHKFPSLQLIINSSTVSLHSLNGRHLPAVKAVQGDCQWCLQNGGNSHQSHDP